MKPLLFFLAVLMVSGCGPSEEKSESLESTKIMMWNQGFNYMSCEGSSNRYDCTNRNLEEDVDNLDKKLSLLLDRLKLEYVSESSSFTKTKAYIKKK